MRKQSEAQLSLPIPEAPVSSAKKSNNGSLYYGSNGFIVPEWGELVWQKQYDKLELYHHGLIEYARHELFQTICIPPKKYPSPPERDLQCFAHQMPERFPCFSMVHPIMTYPRASPAHPIVPEDREALPHHNPHFLDPDYFLKTIYPPFKKFFQAHLRAFIFEFPEHLPTSGMKPKLFTTKLENFAEKIPEEINIAVVLSHKDYFNKDYLEILKRPNLWHVFNVCPTMPEPLEQHIALAEQKEWLVLWAPQNEGKTEEHSQIKELLQTRKKEPCFIIVKNHPHCPAPTAIRELRKTLEHKL
ncbi:MAG: DUF72 domain-containing protein [Myxococcota bacterium]|nr:DUF72 domain-containing protein [Myxococcota bacterium]